MQSVVSVVVVFKRLCVYYKLFSNCKLNFDYPFQFISYTITITFIIILFYLSFSVLYAKLCTLYKRLNGWNWITLLKSLYLKYFNFNGILSAFTYTKFCAFLGKNVLFVVWSVRLSVPSLTQELHSRGSGRGIVERRNILKT